MSHDDTDTTVLEAEPADDLLDEEWMSHDTRRSRWRIVLLTALGVALVFLAGVQVQKHFGASTAGTTATAPGGFTPPEGFPDLTGGGAPPGSSSPAPGGGQDGDTAASLIGTVTKVDGNTWIVTDLGGTKHTVTVTDDTTLLEEQPLGEGNVPKGTTVTISGTGSTDNLTATSVTVR